MCSTERGDRERDREFGFSRKFWAAITGSLATFFRPGTVFGINVICRKAR